MPHILSITSPRNSYKYYTGPYDGFIGIAPINKSEPESNLLN